MNLIKYTSNTIFKGHYYCVKKSLISKNIIMNDPIIKNFYLFMEDLEGDRFFIYLFNGNPNKRKIVFVEKIKYNECISVISRLSSYYIVGNLAYPTKIDKEDDFYIFISKHLYYELWENYLDLYCKEK